MAWLRAVLVLVVAGAVAAAVVSGGSTADQRTPGGLPGLPPPFLGTAVVGDGGLTAAIDAYGDVADLRARPAGRALIDNPADRQAAGSVPADTGVVPKVGIDGEAALPLWRADRLAQHYLPGTNVLRTVARYGPVRVEVTDAAAGGELARIVAIGGATGTRVIPIAGVNLAADGRCAESRRFRRLALVCSTGSRRPGGGHHNGGPASVDAAARQIVGAATIGGRRWIARARPLSAAAPGWARQMYWRSLLALRALTDRRSGAVAAGARDGWAYVWPRDAGAVALGLAVSGYRREARRVARFLLRLDLGAAARFHGDGTAVADREAQGDAAGWVAVAARAAGLRPTTPTLPWHDRPDYQETDPGSYLANALAGSFAATEVDGPQIRLYGGKSTHRRKSAAVTEAFGTARGLVRRSGDPGSGLDSGAAWGVRPFPQPALFPAARRTLLHLAGDQTRFGLTPGEGWPGADPWTAPTAWSAWSFAALANLARNGNATSVAAAGRDRRAALELLAGLRRASTPAGMLPERVDARTGVPRSTTPLAWSHAFAILALRQLWP